MTPSRSFVLFELNEVPLRVVRHYADRHPKSAFARILARGQRWDTIAPDDGHLSPWVTWPTLHRGVPCSDHHIVALGQDVGEANRHFPPIWEMLTNAGRRVGMFGSLHSYPLPRDMGRYDFYVPDTFAAGPEAWPPELSVFQKFNLSMVDRSGRNVSSGVPVKEAVGFLMRSLPAGIRPGTIAKIAKQVTSERIWRHRTTRRRTIQSLLAFDLFATHLESKKPDASFFFTNHVASSMHRYWPATFTDDYQATRWSEPWVRRFSGELDYTMDEADQMLAQLLAFADRNPDFLILISGSMGQAAVDDPSKQVSRQVLLRNMDKFLAELGVRGAWQRRRTMEPTYTLAFDNPASADDLMAAAAKVKIAGQPIRHQRLDANGVEFVLGQYDVPDDDFLTIGNQSVAPDQAGLANVPIADEVASAAYHVPEGMLLAYDPRADHRGRAAAQPVSTTRIAPSLLALQGIHCPSYMQRPLEQLVDDQLELA